MYSPTTAPRDGLRGATVDVLAVGESSAGGGAVSFVRVRTHVRELMHLLRGPTPTRRRPPSYGASAAGDHRLCMAVPQRTHRICPGPPGTRDARSARHKGQTRLHNFGPERLSAFGPCTFEPNPEAIPASFGKSSLHRPIASAPYNLHRYTYLGRNFVSSCLAPSELCL